MPCLSRLLAEVWERILLRCDGGCPALPFPGLHLGQVAEKGGAYSWVPLRLVEPASWV